ncbi:hypothetical protein [Aquipseudomonas campi]
MRTILEKIALAAGLLSALIAAIGPALIAPQFRAVFEGFNAELPTLTTFFIYYYHALWLLPITVIYVWYKWPLPKHGALSSCLIGILGLALVFSVGVVALYLPIFNQGAGA